MRKFLAVAVLVITASSLSAQSKRPATFDDVLNVKAIQGATVSPDGNQVVYGVVDGDHRGWGRDGRFRHQRHLYPGGWQPDTRAGTPGQGAARPRRVTRAVARVRRY